MGNVSPRPTKKLELLVNEVQDFSYNMVYNISQTAEQNIIAVQNQSVYIDLQSIQNCKINISQNADIVVSQITTFKNVFQDPRELMYYIVTGPNSIFNQAIRSSSEIMKDFLANAKKALSIDEKNDYDSNRTLKANLTRIFKFNMSQTTIQRATQNVFVEQTQIVNLLGKLCQDSDINISQNLILNTAQTAIFNVIQDTLIQDPNIKRAIRQFNGDYNSGLVDEYMDAGAKIPDACYNLVPIKEVTRPCPPCQACELNPQDVIDKYYPNSIIFQAWFVYVSVMIILGMLFYLVYLKYKVK